MPCSFFLALAFSIPLPTTHTCTGSGVCNGTEVMWWPEVTFCFPNKTCLARVSDKFRLECLACLFGQDNVMAGAACFVPQPHGVCRDLRVMGSAWALDSSSGF